MDRTGRLHDIHDMETNAWEGGESLITRLIETAGRIVTEAPSKVTGIGIGSAGQIDFVTGSCRHATDALPGWIGMPIAARFRRVLGLPVWVENDANAAALGEQQFGAGRGLNDVVCLTLGTGIGGGVIAGGRILRGAHGAGGELGHIPVEFGGEPCACGSRGCLEAYASATGILRLARQAGLAVASTKEVYQRAASGDGVALSVTERSARYLAQGIIAMIAAYDPQMVLIGGGVSQAGALLFGPLSAHLSSHPFVRGRCEVRPCALGPDAGVVGAAAQVFLYHDQEVLR